jgi:sulfatase maturation enzyme AslB (radical SAM superfamily)
MLDQNFCASPWFHMRITNSGELRYCRWAREDGQPRSNIKDQDPLEFFQRTMAQTRQVLLGGDAVSGCQECHVMEQHGKVSGRQRQLLKAGVVLPDFAKTMLTSPWVPIWRLANQELDLAPQDWQIDLGNYCNSACVFCVPESSSRLAQQLARIGRLEAAVPANWSDDPALVQRFLSVLDRSPRLKYLHFIGGETLITPAFGRILKHLVSSGQSQNITIGFTTNLTVWPQEVVDLICEFQSVNLGMSIETLDQVNDYVRWPSKIHTVKDTMTRWLQLSRLRSWTTTLRITPTALTIGRLRSVYEYVIQQGTSIESCNFLYRPDFMRASVLPREMRDRVADDLQSWIQQHDVSHEQVINTRSPDLSAQAVLQDAQSYVDYLRTAPDESHLLPDLMTYLKDLDQLRDVCVLDYLPEYEDLFRSHGYPT